MRARPLSPDDRRAAIIDATIPLLRLHGPTVSTRQIAEAAGVAEGTLFRAFGDKDTLIQAAVERYFDPEPFRNGLRAIDPDEPTAIKVEQVLALLRARFGDVVNFMSAMQMTGGPPPGIARRRDDEWIGIVERMFRPGELAFPAATLGFYLRLLAFASAIQPFNEPHEFSVEELAALVTRGVLAPESEGD